jgi:chaperonin cofactor prefoldin
MAAEIHALKTQIAALEDNSQKMKKQLDQLVNFIRQKLK